MATQKVRVAVNGYGVIGKRVADAIRVLPDMELVSVSDVTTDYRVKAAVNEPIVVPESVDAVRALSGRVTDGEASFALTDQALGMRREFPVPAAQLAPAGQR